MRCLLAIPLLAGVIFPPVLAAQYRIGPRSFSATPPGVTRNFASSQAPNAPISKAGGAFSVVSPFRVETRSPWMAPAPQPRMEFGFRGRHSRPRPSFFINPLPLAYSLSNSFSLPYDYYAPMFYPSLWPPLDEEYLQASQIAHGDVAGEVASQQKDLLSSQVQALTQEVEALRQGSTPQPAAAPQAAVHRKLLPTIFLYRDGRSVEARNYAIFNQTLWIFGAETTRRVPLSELNLAATLKLNETRGIDVTLPKPQ